MGLLSSATDFLYGTGRAKNAFELLNPNEPVLMATACKARQPAAPNLGAGWAFSKRSALLITEQRMLCGDWDIPIDALERVSYSSFNGVTSKGMVLTVLTRDGESYQFGLGKSEDWLKPFPTRVEADGAFGPNGVVIWMIRAAILALLFSDYL